MLRRFLLCIWEAARFEQKVQEVNNKYAGEGYSKRMATSHLFLAENRQKVTVPNLSGENPVFS